MITRQPTRTPKPRWWSWLIVGCIHAAGIAIVAISVVWGRRLQRAHPEIFLGAAPLVGRNMGDGWDWRFGWGLVGAGAIGVLIAIGLVRGWWWRIRLRWLLIITGLAAGAFAVLLAATDGTDGLFYGAEHKTEYWINLRKTPPAGEFVRGFVAHINRYSVHVRGHPPGYLLVLKVVEHLGLHGVWPTVALSVLATIALPVAVLVAVWAVAGDDWTRRSAPLLVVAPYAVWMVTSADAFFAAVAACGVAAFVLGLRTRGWRSGCWGLLSGAFLGSLLFLSYGGAVFVFVPLVPALVALRRRCRVAALTITGVALTMAASTLAFYHAGFWWFAGAAETRNQYWAGTAKFRPRGYFFVANIAITCIAIGPAGFSGVVRMWRRRRTVGPAGSLVVGGCTALVVSLLSQYSKGETERIWLMLFPWLLVAGATLITRSGRRLAIAAVSIQTVAAVLLQASLVSKW